MNAQFLVFFGLFFTVYSMANYYVGLRGWQAFRALPAFPGGRFYSVLFVLIAFSYIIERIVGEYLPGTVNTALSIMGGTWMAILYYLVLFCVAVDLIRLADRFWVFIPAKWREDPALAGSVVVALVALIVAFGMWNAAHTVWRQYDIAIDKPAGGLRELKIILVTDIHLGKVVGNSRLESLVEAINAREPDLVLLGGDVIDEDIGHFVDQGMAATFRRLHPRFGVFAVLGNHEYIGRQTEVAVELLRSSGITVLRDSYFTVMDHFIVAGRDDWDRPRFTNTQRKPLQEFLKGVDTQKPLLLLDHQPRSMPEAAETGVDLMMSGHTHRGQLFPNQWVTGSLYETDWGYLRKGAMNVIVSAGFGTWGPPVRTSAASEVVEIRVTFTP